MRPPTPHPDDRSGAACSRFPPVHLTRDRLDAFHATAQKTLSKTVREFVKLGSRAIDTQRWKYLRSRAGTSVYLDRRQESDTQNSSLLVAGTVKARLADLMEGLYMDTSEDTRLVQHRFHPRFVDAEVLEVIERRSGDRPYNFTGLKWSLLKSSNTGIVSNRDLCFLEKLGTIDLAGGRKLGYFIMQSVHLRECPPSASSKVVRAHISLCYLFEETKNGLVGIYMTGNMVSFGPKILWKLARNNFADVVLSVGNIVNIAHAKRYTRLMRTKHEQDTKTPSHTSVCELCRSLQSFFERHRACAGCQKMSVCKKCRHKREVFHREDHVSLRLARASFCYECIEGVRRPHRTQAREAAKPTRIADPARERERHHTSGASVSSADSNSTSGYKHSSFTSTNPSTASEDEGDAEVQRDSERSLRVFSYQIKQELYNAGYDEADEADRLTGLVMLGAGEQIEESACDRDSGITFSSFTSSAFSFCDDDDDNGDVARDNEDIQSIQPKRRSLQPPEMLEAQRFTADGSLRSQARSYPPRSGSMETNANLLTRLVEASRLAEQTQKMTKENARRAETKLRTPPTWRSQDELGSFTM